MEIASETDVLNDVEKPQFRRRIIGLLEDDDDWLNKNSTVDVVIEVLRTI